METVEIKFGGDAVTVRWDPAQAAAPIMIRGEDGYSASRHQTADARHATERMVRLVAREVWGEGEGSALEFGEDSSEWAQLSYDTLPDGK